MLVASSEATSWIPIKCLLNRNDKQDKCLFTHLRMWSQILSRVIQWFSKRFFSSVNSLSIKTPTWNILKLLKRKQSNIHSLLLCKMVEYKNQSVFFFAFPWSIIEGEYRVQRPSLHKKPHGEEKGQQQKVTQGQVLPQYKKQTFKSENNHWLEQPFQGPGSVPITGGFQGAIGQGSR